MNEVQRRAYLSAMAIDSYVPRWVLPAAPESQPCELPPLPEAVAESPLPIDAAPTRPPAAAPQNRVDAAEAAAAVLSNLQITPAAQVKPKPIAAPAAEPQASSAAVEPFALTTWRVSDDLLVIDSRQAQLALPTDRLLSNILIALGYQPGGLPKAEVYRWPFIDNQILDPANTQGETEAREMLHAFVDGQLVLAPVKFLLLMGAEAGRFILPADAEPAASGAIALEQFGATAVVTPSLAALLREPSLKAQAWQALQPLRLAAT